MIPYELRLIHAEAPSFSTNPYESITRIQKLEFDTETAFKMAQQIYPNDPAISVWQQRLEEVRLKYAQILFRLKVFNFNLKIIINLFRNLINLSLHMNEFWHK